MFKRLLCTHSWRHVHSLIFDKHSYGCVKCGKISKVYGYDVAVWKFKRTMKGETFE